MNAAVIVAAGQGTRIGFDKLMASLGGVPVLRHSLAAFEACPGIDAIWVVAGAERAAAMQPYLTGLSKLRGFVAGGAERQHSVHAGVMALPAAVELVAVHDGARPLIHPDHIAQCLAVAATHGAAASARRLTDTIKRADAAGCIIESISREGLWAMETPQVCRREWLLAALADLEAAGRTVTDEVSALEHGGHAVQLVENPWPNLKITLPGDLELAARLVS